MSLHCIYSWAVVLSTKTLKFFKKARPPSRLDGRDTNTYDGFKKLKERGIHAASRSKFKET